MAYILRRVVDLERCLVLAADGSEVSFQAGSQGSLSLQDLVRHGAA